MKINRNKWQTDFEKELDKAERRQLSSVKSYYKNEYAKGINSFLAEGQTNFQLLFQESDLSKIYRNLYTDIGLQFAKWYAKSYDKYLQKGENPLKYATQWENTFASFGSAVGAQRVTLVSGTAKQTLIKITQNLMRDPDFMSVGNAEKGRILKSQFNKYSSYQAERLVRTEATNAANFATMESATTIFPGAKMQKEWIASFDDRTRDTHAEVGASEPIPYNDAFMVGGNFLMYPGDPSGPSAEVINCRCSVAPFPVTGAQTVGEITDINFGMGGAQSTGFGLGDVASAISSTLVGAGENTAFIPAKNLKEAEDRMLNFAPKVDFKGLKLAEQNEILQAIEEVLGKYNVKLTQDIGFQIKKRRSVGVAGRDFDNNALYIRIQKTFSKNSLKEQEKLVINFNKSKEDRIIKFEKILAQGTRPKQLLDKTRLNLEALQSAKRWAIYQDGTRPLYKVAVHEAFHSVDYKYGLRDIFFQELKKQNVIRSDWYKVSEYGASELGELWTETATAIHTGTKIPIEFVNAFNETIKKITGL